MKVPDDPLDTTLAEPPEASAEARRAAATPLEDDRSRYEVGDVLGRGGMGEVVFAHDRRVDRDVALKRMRASRPEEADVARFLREARIQARLDHPAIVPVHDVGMGGDGLPFFTMKRLTGVTVAELLAREPARQRLLRAFVDVCLAIDLAHSRGVIHRDLKPSNIMLGDFGEVYVLDWGLARMVGETEEAIVRGEPIPRDDDATATGAMLGTPGYMAPEQIRDAAHVDRAADVYALGAILFEILAGEPVHPRGQGALASTLDGVEGSPARRVPDRAIPPELDALCVAMLASEPAARPTARAVADGVQAFLDGDRDVARRRALAEQELGTARAALAENRRAVAMRAAGRALALDPESLAAAELVSALMLEPPAQPPPGLRSHLLALEQEFERRHAAITRFTLMLGLVAMLLVISGKVTSWVVPIALVSVAVGLAISAHLLARRGQRSRLATIAYAVGVGVIVALTGRLCGPLLLAPSMACLMIAGLMMYSWVARRPWVAYAIILGGWLGPIGLEALHQLGTTWAIRDGEVIGMSHCLQLGGPATVALLFGGSLLTVAVAGYHMLQLSRAHLDAQHRLATQAWHLRQLLPADPPM